MLRLESFVFNPFQENTYLLINEKNECWIVDPGMYDATEKEQLLRFIQTNQLQPQAIINTHAHIDHIWGVQFLKEQFKIPFLLHEKDQPVLQAAVASAAMFGLDFSNIPTVDAPIKEGKMLQLGTDTVEVRWTPGHSPGSVTFYNAQGKFALAGDVLFNRSIGRTDLPGGSFDTLIQSIKNELFTLPDETLVYAGHGPFTKIADEKKYNPFLN
jgi:glyoxylase-like metal-dependent hydrolase (beta-lactamase superfamily II)